MNTRNQTLYRATFTGLRMLAFGVDWIAKWEPEIEIYQARVSPELWRARPMMKNGYHAWEAFSAERLMAIITSDFVGTVKPWREYPGGKRPWVRPTLTITKLKEDDVA